MIDRYKIMKALQAGAIGLIGLGLASCGGSDNSGAVSTSTPVAAPLEDHFGTQFGVDFRMAANTNPVKPAAGDIIALTLVANPMALH
jgi:hypothetical protein